MMSVLLASISTLHSHCACINKRGWVKPLDSAARKFRVTLVLLTGDHVGRDIAWNARL